VAQQQQLVAVWGLAAVLQWILQAQEVLQGQEVCLQAVQQMQQQALQQERRCSCCGC
jgi:hypothetical protein